MIATIFPSSINGSILIPASKSIMQRACALALLNEGSTVISNPGESNDELAALDIIRALGAELNWQDQKLIINSSGIVKGNTTIHCGESGLACRMFLPIVALSHLPVVLNGNGSLLQRPIYFMEEIFPPLNVTVDSTHGFLPVTVTGPLRPGNISIDGSQSSQYLTGLLIAFARQAIEPVTIHVTNLQSKPYVDLTLDLLGRFGYSIKRQGYEKFYIEPVKQTTKAITCDIEADWSSAALLLVAGATSGVVSLKGMDINSLQADKAILNVLKHSNADLYTDNKNVTVSADRELRAFTFDATDCPDLFPALAVLAANCVGTSIIKGTSRLKGKESNRAETIVEVFTKMGVDIKVKNEQMIIAGTDNIKSASLTSHNDHRIAMAVAIAALKANGPVIIRQSEAVNKSYPGFFKHLQLLGAAVSLSAE